MEKNKFKSFLSSKSLPKYSIFLIILVCVVTNFFHHQWTVTKSDNRGVIKWDVISYYAYLPALFIYNDVGLDFVEDPGFNNDSKFWYIQTEEGGKLIQTSMGLSILYSPFFLMAHVLAPVFGESRDGFGSIYQFFLVFSSLVYLFAGLWFLRKLLLRHFSPLTTALTLMLITLGTNLYYYSTYEAAMSHSYNFSLIAIFLYLIAKWYENPGWGITVVTGLLFGLIVLIRPSNVLIIFLLILWGVYNRKTLTDRILFYFSNYTKVLLMVLAFFLVWLPQFLYWHKITGHFIYNSYEDRGSSFFFDAPHVLDLLFSYRKGWFLYIPMMFLAALGIIPLYRKLKPAFYMVLVYMIVMIYVMASWWSWWFGGSFGPRSLVDTYAVMAFPLAALISNSQLWYKYFRYTLFVVFAFFLYLNFLQTYQYHHGLIHHLGNTKKTYQGNFLHWKSGPDFWQNLSIPDFELARQGIYYYYSTGDDFHGIRKMEESVAKDSIIQEIKSNERIMKDIKRYAKRNDIPFEEAINRVTDRIYYMKTEGKPY